MIIIKIDIESIESETIMNTKNESRLRTSVTIPEMNIPLSLLFDLVEFSNDRRRQIKEKIDSLKRALDSEYIDRQRNPIDVKNDLELAINDANLELGHWHMIHKRLNTISHDILENLRGEGTTSQDKKPQVDTEAKETKSTYVDPNKIDEWLQNFQLKYSDTMTIDYYILERK